MPPFKKSYKNNIIILFLILTAFIFILPAVLYADEKQDAYLYVAKNLFEKGQYDKALLNYEKAYELGELPPNDLALMIICYTKVKKFKEAQSLLEKAFQQNANNPIFLLAGGILNFDQRNYSKAYEYFQNAYKKDNSLIQAKRGIVSSLVNMGVNSYKENKKIAEDYFTKALEFDPDFVPALQNMAVLLFEKKSYKKALEFIDRALKYDPTNRKVLELKYYIFYRLKDYNSQIKVLLRLVILYPDNAEYWAMLGKVYEETGQIKKSIESFSNARRYNSSNPYPYYRLAEYYFNKKKDITNTVYILKEGIGKALYMIGQIKISAIDQLQSKKSNLSENDIKSIAEMAKLIEEPKKILDDSLVLLRRALKNDESYRKELTHLISLYPHSVELQIALANFYTEKKLYKDAVELWRFILVKNSRNIDAYKGISYCYKKMGDIKKAIKSYKIALDIDPGDKSIYENLIELYREQKELEVLYEEWKERLYMDKRNPVLLRELAKIEKILGKNKDAEMHLKRADIVEAENKAYEEKQKEKKK